MTSTPWSRKGSTLPSNKPLLISESKPQIESHLRSLTPARILTGRTGSRYLTESYLGLRADHAIALDAVNSTVPDGWAEKQGWIPLQSKSENHQQFLLFPETGRHLNDTSRQRLEQSSEKNVDIQMIAADGLSAQALLQNGAALVTSLTQSLSSAGFRIGKTVFVKYARIGVQDEIGVLTQAKSTLIIVGERPGLGTGDSLSIYTAYGPKPGQDNSEKDCISNIRPLGFSPGAAAARCAELMKATFASKGGGVKLLGATKK